MEGLSSVAVSDFGEIQELLERAMAQRAIRDTLYNDHSSRSHTIFQASVIQTCTAPGSDGQPVTTTTSSKLSFVDLAGSEKWKAGADNASGSAMSSAHLREMTAINKSLSSLATCILALGQADRHHVPYRDSALTRLLQDSLGGNAFTAFVVAVCASEACLDETHSSLQFADRARC